MTIKDIINNSINNGLAGAKAMTVQVCTLMPVRTVMNYQYRYGKTTTQAFSHLWQEGGMRRLYRGVGPALFQAPLSRFGDTASNALMLSIFQDSSLPIWMQTGAASLTTALWRVNLMPLDALKTTLQVEGAGGFSNLSTKIKKNGMGALYHGTGATFMASAVGHWPWFVTYNYLDTYLPQNHKLLRSAFIGFTASVISDTTSNSIRVLKTVKQTNKTAITYPEAFALVVEKDGLGGLFGRGLKTRILANGMQGLLFSVLWKYFTPAPAPLEKVLPK